MQRKVKIIGSFFNDVIAGKVYDVLDKKGTWIVTDLGLEYNLEGSYNQENYVIQYEIVK